MVAAKLALQPGLAQRLVGWRRHLHQYPELSFQEHETSTYIAQQLDKMNITADRPTETGVVGVIQGNGPGPTVAIRADIDALPIQEENDVEYRSRRPGVMHACGHDGHAAIALGAAELLAAHRKLWSGQVKLLFQPAEEVPPGGARQFIDAGVLQGVDAIVGLHLIATMPVGQAGLRPGPMMANTGRFEITVVGELGHGATPHRRVDTVLTASQIVVNLQSIISRQKDPLEPAVITVSHVTTGVDGAGRETARLTGTISCLDDELLAELNTAVENYVEQTCQLAGAKAQTEFQFVFPALYNDQGVADVLAQAARQVLGRQGLVLQPPVMIADDFAYYCREVPGAYLFLGAKTAAERQYPHHHPRFDFNEAALLPGVQILSQAALNILRA